MYATKDDVMNYLYGFDLRPLTRNGASIDALIDRFLVLAQREMDQKMGQTLEQETLADMRMDGPGSWELALPHYPIQTLSALQIVYGFNRLVYKFSNIRHTASKMLPYPFNQQGDGTPGDVFVDRDSGVMHIDLTGSLLSLASMPGTYPVWNVSFTAGQRDVIATYTHGFPPGSIPEDLKAAHAILTALKIGQMAIQRSTEGANRVKIGSVERQWGDNKMGGMFEDWMATVNNALSYYTNKPLGGLV